MNRIMTITMLVATLACAGPITTNTETKPDRLAKIVTVEGTQIIGKISSMKDGKYIIESESLGELTIEDRKVKSITYLDGEEAAKLKSGSRETDTTAVEGELSREQVSNTVESVGLQIVTNDESMRLIEQLLEDPEILDLFTDEQFVKDAQDGNYTKLMQNKKLQELTDDSVAIRRLVDTLLGRPLRDPQEDQ